MWWSHRVKKNTCPHCHWFHCSALCPFLTQIAPALFFDVFVLEGIITVGCNIVDYEKMRFLITRDKKKTLIWKTPESEVVAINLFLKKFFFFKLIFKIIYWCLTNAIICLRVLLWHFSVHLCNTSTLKKKQLQAVSGGKGDWKAMSWGKENFSSWILMYSIGKYSQFFFNWSKTINFDHKASPFSSHHHI